MNKIKIDGYDDMGENVIVTHNGVKIHSVVNMGYESSDATSCVELLVSMAKNGLIELEVSDYITNNFGRILEHLV